jgi:hypothetical protein
MRAKVIMNYSQTNSEKEAREEKYLHSYLYFVHRKSKPDDYFAHIPERKSE